MRFLPEIVINDIIFKGTPSEENVFEALCMSFKDVPEYCQMFVEVTFKDKLFAVAVMSGVFCMVLCINLCIIIGMVRRNVSTMAQDTRDEVRRQMQQYQRLDEVED